MAYSLDAKIIAYLTENGISDAGIKETILVLPTETGELHRRIDGFVTADKLDRVIADYKASVDAPA